MHGLVRHHLAPLTRRERAQLGAREDVAADGEGARAEGGGCGLGRRARVDAHAAEALAEAVLERLPDGRLEPFCGIPRGLLHELRRGCGAKQARYAPVPNRLLQHHQRKRVCGGVADRGSNVGPLGDGRGRLSDAWLLLPQRRFLRSREPYAT